MLSPKLIHDIEYLLKKEKCIELQYIKNKNYIKIGIKNYHTIKLKEE